MLTTYAITVTGKVQGVYYRQSTKEKARELGITGYIKNQPDGTVYIIATGTEEQLQQLVNWCKQGPPRAGVDTVQTQVTDAQVFSGFTIQH